MRRLLYLATLLVGMALGSLYPLSLLAQTRSAIGNMQADNAAAGSRLGLSVVVLDGSGNPVTSFGGSGGTAMIDDAAFTVGTTNVTPAAGIYRSVLDSVTDGDAGAFAMLANRIQMVHMVDSSGGAVSVGGGVQYTEADTDASITGTALMLEGAADTLVAAPGTAADGLLVNLGTNNDVTVTSGSVTANAGTNLNTSALLTTAAFEAILGTAGTADTQVVTVQGIASMTPILATLSGTNTVATVTTLSQLGGVALPIEDAAETAAGVGIYAMTVRRDTAASSAGTTGDNATLNTDAAGHLWTRDITANTIGSTTSGQSGVLGMGAVTTAAPTYTNAQTAGLSLTTGGSLRVDVMNGGGGGTSAIDDADFVDGTTVFTLAGAVAESASPTTVTEGDMGSLAMTLNRALKVTLYGTDGTALTPSSDATHDSAVVATGPQMMLDARTSTPTAVATANAVRAMGGIDGVQIVRPHSLLENRVSAVVGVTDGSSTQLIPVQGAGIRFCATSLVVSNSSATNVTVDFRDGTAGAVLATVPAAAYMGGAVWSLQTPLCTTANTIFAMDPSASASTVTATAVGFKTSL